MKRLMTLLAVAILSAAAALAAPMAYTVSIDTSMYVPAGTGASLDFNFASASDSSDAGTLTVSGFSSDATLGGAGVVLFGDVTGDLPGVVVMQNLPAGGSYYYRELTTGSFITFGITLDGPMVNAPSGGTDGTTITISLLGLDLTPIIDPVVLQIDIDGLGQIVISDLPDGVTLREGAPVPEPGTVALLGAGLAGLALARRRAGR